MVIPVRSAIPAGRWIAERGQDSRRRRVLGRRFKARAQRSIGLDNPYSGEPIVPLQRNARRMHKAGHFYCARHVVLAATGRAKLKRAAVAASILPFTG
ncbi:MAG: hypothetical protein WC729_26040 [Sphingomonas sp.]|jgi:hypothetical protein|uniref:hypothetical protein n=1 Tax=Sphingomonas sp. TaxID=28214 RepID=UPI0035623A9F